MSENPDAWRQSENTLARQFSREDLASQWIYGNKLSVRPGETAVWLSRGKVVKIVAEGQTIAASVSDRLKKLFTQGEDLVLLMMDLDQISLNFRLGADKDTLKSADPDFLEKALGGPTDTSGALEAETAKGLELETDKGEEARTKPPGAQAQAEAPVAAVLEDIGGRVPILTKDRQHLVFDVRLTFTMPPDRAADLFKLFKGRPTLDKWHVAEQAREKLETAFFAPAIARHTAEDLQKNMDLLAQYNNDARRELTRWLYGYGLQLDRLAINPGLTAAERAKILEKEKEALAGAMETRHKHELSEMRRDHGRMLLREKLASQVELAQAQKDLDKQGVLRALFLEEKERELAGAGYADKIARIRQETGLLAKKKEQEIEAYAKKRGWEIEKERMALASELEMESMRSLAREHRLNKEQKARQRMRELELRRQIALEERDHIEKILELGKGALTADVLKEAIRQESVRKAITEGNAAGEAFAESEGRRFVVEETGKGAAGTPLIGIASQGPLYLGTSGGAGNPGNTGLRLLPGNGETPGAGALPAMTVCPSCGETVPHGMAFCGYCGTRLG
jgi:hypothetical protein